MFRKSDVNFQFQAPNIDQKLISNPAQEITGGLENLFNSYMAYKKNRDQETMQKLQLGFNPSDVTPEILAQAQKPAPTGQPAMFAPQGAPPQSDSPVQSALNLGQTQTPTYPLTQDIPAQPALAEHPMVAHVRQYLANRDISTKNQQGLVQSEIVKNLGSAGNASYSTDQAASLMSPSQNPADIAKTKANLMSLYPNGIVPKDFAHVAATNNRMELTTGVRQDQFAAAQFEKLNHDANPDVAGPRKLVGMAGALNRRVAAGLKNTEGPVTNQQLNGAVADIAAMLTNGAADDQAIKAQNYSTIQGKLNDLKTLFTGAPTANAPQPVVDRVRKTLQEMGSINDDVIKRNLDTSETVYGSSIPQEKLSKFRAGIEKHLISTQASGGTAGAAPLKIGRFQVEIH